MQQVTERKGEWMPVHSGGRFYPQDPREEDIHIEDIAHGLAMTPRYSGQMEMDKYYSVAEHSFLMAYYIEWRGCGPTMALCFLLHDAAEAYMGDLVRAVKLYIGDGYKTLEKDIERAIFMKFGIYGHMGVHKNFIKEIDNRILMNERDHLFDSSEAWHCGELQPLEHTVLRCYSPQSAKAVWLSNYERLKRGRDLEVRKIRTEGSATWKKIQMA